jgi:hypothetical protein
MIRGLTLLLGRDQMRLPKTCKICLEKKGGVIILFLEEVEFGIGIADYA